MGVERALLMEEDRDFFVVSTKIAHHKRKIAHHKQPHDDAGESMAAGSDGVDDADDSEAVLEETAVQPPQGGVLTRAHLLDAARSHAVEIEEPVAGEVADEMRERREEATRI